MQGTVPQKRKGEAPFYTQIHQWLLGARHKQACRKHEAQLLSLQEELLGGLISREEMQRQVRILISAPEPVQIRLKPIEPHWWHHAGGSDTWRSIAGLDATRAEILFRKTTGGKGLQLTFRYELSFETPLATNQFVFGLLNRFFSTPKSFDERHAISGAQHLTAVNLSYAPLNMDVKSRWDFVESRLRSQEDLQTQLVRGLQMLQRKLRNQPIYDSFPILKKKKKKKKRVAKTLDDEITYPNETEAIKQNLETELVENSIEKPANTEKPANAENPVIADPMKFIDEYSMSTLSGEIRDLVSHIYMATTKKQQATDDLIRLTKSVLLQVLPCAKLQLFGSHACGFALPSSDIDLYYEHRGDACFFDPAYKQHLQYFEGKSCFMLDAPVTTQLEIIQNTLRQQPWVKKSTLIRSATMPIIRTHACLLALNEEAEDTHLTTSNHLCPLCCVVDLSCGHTPGHSNMLASSLLQQQSLVFPHLKPLMLVLKQMMVERNMCNVFEGGISSFALALLLLRYLQHTGSHPIRTNAVLTKTKTYPPGDVSAYQRQLADWPNTNGSYASYTVSQGRNPDSKVNANEKLNDRELQAYHRQLNDWPSMDAAHHYIWMQAIGKARSPNPPTSVLASASALDPVGELLLGFLNFYGNEFDPQRVGITVIGEGAYYQLPESTFSSAPQPLVIDNPCWPNLNVASASYKMSLIFAEFKSIHATLYHAMILKNQEASYLRKVLKVKWGNQDRQLLRNALSSK